MKTESSDVPFLITIATVMLNSYKLRTARARTRRRLRGELTAAVTLLILLFPAGVAQSASSQYRDSATLKGTVLSPDGKPASEAVVSIEKEGSPHAVETKTDTAGVFAFSSLSTGSYRLHAEKSGLRSSTMFIVVPENGKEKIDLTLQTSSLTAPSAQTMEFSDQPNFTIAGVTDWTAVGGHGSDSALRTSESLASETLTLKPESTDNDAAMTSVDASREKAAEVKLRKTLSSAPDNFDANHRLGELYLRAKRYNEAIPLLERAYRREPANEANQYDLGLAYKGGCDLAKARQSIRGLLAKHPNAELHRLMGELDEQAGDPLSAVHEYEAAAKLSPSEQNYFEWGSELLLHRAVWQAQEVFRKGVGAYPKSGRMQTALGTALFAGARYDEAALHLCAASDLNPADPNPYLFMGKIQMAAPNALPCVEPKLARFVQQQPGSSVANYLYAMSILKSQKQPPDNQAVEQATSLLKKAVVIDPKCSEAYLQLGILAASDRDFDTSISLYSKAIDANPELADAHYRLGMAYDRTGQPEKARQEFALHDRIKQQQAEATEHQRREIKQFLFAQPGTPPASKPSEDSVPR